MKKNDKSKKINWVDDLTLSSVLHRIVRQTGVVIPNWCCETSRVQAEELKISVAEVEIAKKMLVKLNLIEKDTYNHFYRALNNDLLVTGLK